MNTIETTPASFELDTCNSLNIVYAIVYISLILSLVSSLFSHSPSSLVFLHLMAEMHHAPHHQRCRSKICGPKIECP